MDKDLIRQANNLNCSKKREFDVRLMQLRLQES